MGLLCACGRLHRLLATRPPPPPPPPLPLKTTTTKELATLAHPDVSRGTRFCRTFSSASAPAVANSRKKSWRHTSGWLQEMRKDD
ncbi:hypothetical protein GUJ93_ZPchr0007g4697 [Zizania palustris]|uniref:Uncharacterized protein n=1 Tax=Zizania palustris TaxID=103762 RepID=A0A8J5T0U7_ZIZPA|nr:hypothetical protein GUJ93_ZPchr0007g4697 [Zizania palustris]